MKENSGGITCEFSEKEAKIKVFIKKKQNQKKKEKPRIRFFFHMKVRTDNGAGLFWPQQILRG